MQLVDIATPEPGPGEVRVRVHSSGVNPVDVKTRGGARTTQLAFPHLTPHSDGAGVIDAIQPWIVYLARLGCVQQREGRIDRETVLTKDVENEQATDALAQVAVVCDVLKCLRAAVAEAAVKGDATVTHWRNVIRDLPAK